MPVARFSLMAKEKVFIPMFTEALSRTFGGNKIVVVESLPER